MKQFDVYGLGNALVDMEFQVDDEFLDSMRIEKGIMTLVEEDDQQKLIQQLSARGGKKASGGSAANTLIAISAMGGSTYYTCKVADDEYGHFYLNDLRAAGVDTNMNGKHEGGTTGKCVVMVTDDAERTMHTFLGISSDLSVSDLNKEHIAASQYCYMEGYLVTSPSAKEANIEARKTAEANGVKTALTFSDPAIVEFFEDDLTDTIGNGIDLLFCNASEALSYTKKDNIDDAVEVIKTFSKNFAVTLGADGAIVYDGSTLYEIAANKVNAIDSNGAGDSFAGAFLYGITNGYSFEDAGNLASLTASKVVSQFGPRLSIENYKKLVA